MHKYLMQAMLAESISRLEDAVRTGVEFENVIEWCDIRDKKIRVLPKNYKKLHPAKNSPVPRYDRPQREGYCG